MKSEGLRETNTRPRRLPVVGPGLEILCSLRNNKSSQSVLVDSWHANVPRADAVKIDLRDETMQGF